MLLATSQEVCGKSRRQVGYAGRGHRQWRERWPLIAIICGHAAKQGDCCRKYEVLPLVRACGGDLVNAEQRGEDEAGDSGKWAAPDKKLFQELIIEGDLSKELVVAAPCLTGQGLLLLIKASGLGQSGT